MKKLVLTAVVALSSLAMNAQVWLGGSLGFNYTDKDNGTKVTDFTISPEIGYSLNDKWDIAVAINETYTNYDLKGDIADYHTNSFSINPYARYTFAKSGIASFFVEGGVLVGSEDVKLENADKTESQTTWGIGIRPGVKVALSDKVSLVAKLGYLGYKDVEDSYSKFGFGVDNNSLSLGMYFSF